MSVESSIVIPMNSIYIKIDGYWFDVTKVSHPISLKRFHLKECTEMFNNQRGHAGVDISDYVINNDNLVAYLNTVMISKNSNKKKFYDVA